MSSARFEYSVEGRFRRAPEFFETTGENGPSQCIFSGHGAERWPIVRQRIRGATQSRRCGKRAADGIEVFFDSVAGHWLNDQSRSVRRQRFAGSRRGTYGFAHVMQAIKEANQIELFVGHVRGI